MSLPCVSEDPDHGANISVHVAAHLSLPPISDWDCLHVCALGLTVSPCPALSVYLRMNEQIVGERSKDILVLASEG